MKSRVSIAGLTIGVVALLGMTTQAVYATSYTSTQVAQHNVASDCWEVINGKVYDLTEFIPLHSGGQSVIIAQCGKDATAVFNSGPHSASTLSALSGYLLGDLSAAIPVVTPTSPVTTAGTSAPSQEPTIPIVTPPTQASPEFTTTRDDDEDEDEDENSRANVSETRHAKKERASNTGGASSEQEDRDDSSGEDD